MCDALLDSTVYVNKRAAPSRVETVELHSTVNVFFGVSRQTILLEFKRPCVGRRNLRISSSCAKFCDRERKEVKNHETLSGCPRFALINVKKFCLC